MTKKFAVSGQHYLFDVQSFAAVVLSLGGDAYEYALRDRTTKRVIEDVANGDSEIGVTIQIHAIGTVENVTIYIRERGNLSK